MATSGTFAFTANRGQVIRAAMLSIGRLGDQESPTAQETSDCAFFLNALIKQWMGKTDFAPGLKVFTRRRGTLFLKNTTGPYIMGPSNTTGWTTETPVVTQTTVLAAAAATAVTVSNAAGIATGMKLGIKLDSGAVYWTAVSSVAGNVVNFITGALPSQASSGSYVYSYTITGQKCLGVSAVVLRDNQMTDTPMTIMTSEQYDFLPNKMDPQNTGDPTSVYIENQRDYTYLYTDIAVAQDTSKYLVVTFLEPTQDVNQDSDEFEYPQEWFLALSWGLAKQICPMFSCVWTPLMQENFANALAIAGHKDAEVTSLHFQPYDFGN